jgi:hypothetical protein
MTLAPPSTTPLPARRRIEQRLFPSGWFNGTLLTGSKGTGKSTLLGELTFTDFIQCRPQFVLDPIGVGTIDSFLGRLIRYVKGKPLSEHARLFERLRYVNVASAERIVPFPLLYKTGVERSLLEVAERYLNTILLSNPWLLHAQVQGWPPLHYIGAQTAIVLAALDYPLTLAVDLLRHPEEWRNTGKFAEAITRHPTCAPAVSFFTEEYITAGQANRRRLLNPYFDKLFVFNLDPNLRAMFGAKKPGIDFDEVEQNGLTVLIDFRQETDPQLKRFKLLWIFSAIYEYIRLRGRKEQPLGLLIDEMASLSQHVPGGENPLAGLLDEFLNVYMRNHHIFFTCALQSLFQVDEKLLNSLLSLGNYAVARVATLEEARAWADLLFAKDPFRLKHCHKVWGKVDPPPLSRSASYDYAHYGARSTDSSKWQSPDFPYYVLDTEPGEYMSLDDQREEAANRLTRLGLFEFFLRPSLREGEVSSAVYPVSIAGAVRDNETGAYQFSNQETVAKVRSLLEAAAGHRYRDSLRSKTRWCLGGTSNRGDPAATPRSGKHPYRVQGLRRRVRHRSQRPQSPVASGYPRSPQ